jgi:hypothetical protein
MSEAIGQTEPANVPGSTLHRSPKRLRSAVTNGSKTFLQGNGWSPWARRQRDLIEIFATDAGGLENLTPGKLSLIHRAATLQVELESADGRLSLGETIDILAYATLANCLRRIIETIGVERPEKVIDHGPLANHFGDKRTRRRARL